MVYAMIVKLSETNSGRAAPAKTSAAPVLRMTTDNIREICSAGRSWAAGVNAATESLQTRLAANESSSRQHAPSTGHCNRLGCSARLGKQGTPLR